MSILLRRRSSAKILIRSIHQSQEIHRIIRNTHASEVFRTAYLDSSRSSTRISTSDLDDLVIAQRTRPSALLGVFGLAGVVLGGVSRVLPNGVRELVNTLVNDATTQQMNDNIRELHTIEGLNDDLKETIKYHRDMEIGGNTATSSGPQESPQINYVQTVVSTAFSKALKITKDI